MPSTKVVVFVEYFPPRMGSDRRIFELMKRLEPKHEVHFVVFPPVRSLISTAGSTAERLRPEHENTSVVYEGITGHFVGVPRFMTEAWRSSILAAYFLTAPFLLIKTIRKLAELKPNVIVLNYPSPYTGLLGFVAGKILRKPVVLDFNDLIAQYTANLLDLKKDGFKARMLVYIQDYIAKNSQRVVAPTSFIKKYAIANRTTAAKVMLIPNGVDTEIFNPKKYDNTTTKKKGKTCLYCGRLDSWAGINIIAKLCDIANDRKINMKFVLVGSGKKKIPSKENVISYGELPYEEVPRILATAYIILVPFPKNEISHAASPLKLFEGMAMQKPVIASRVKGIEEVISEGENGLLADPEDVEDWLAKIESVLQSEEDAIRIGQNARRTVEEKFSWNHLAKQFEKALTIAVVEHHKPT